MVTRIMVSSGDTVDHIAIVCNGQMEETPSLRQRLERCGVLMGVDGGINHCHRMGFKPQYLVGDFDSVDQSVLKEFMAENTTELRRAKDKTDLEVAIERAREISQTARIIIFAGLGNRIDHTLANLFLLLRNPGVLFMETENQEVFAIDETSLAEISDHSYRTLAIYPLNGRVQNVLITSDAGRVHCGALEKAIFSLPIPPHCFISMSAGRAIVVLDKRVVRPLSELDAQSRKVNFLIDQPLIHIFAYLSQQSAHPKMILSSETETVQNIQPSTGEVCFRRKVGQTISLIPLHGPATGIVTKGLKWELGPSTGLMQLDRDFVGISNVAMQEEVSVQITGGELLCVINENLVDMDMVEAKKASGAGETKQRDGKNNES